MLGEADRIVFTFSQPFRPGNGGTPDDRGFEKSAAVDPSEQPTAAEVEGVMRPQKEILAPNWSCRIGTMVLVINPAVESLAVPSGFDLLVLLNK